MESSLFAVVDGFTSGWSMSFQSVHFFLFLPIVAGAYFLLPAKLRAGWLLAASYYFYFFAAPRYLIILLIGTLFAYGMGRAIAATKKHKRAVLLAAVAGHVLGLCIFKYYGFFAFIFYPIFAPLGVDFAKDFFIAASATGISFYTFMAIGYLLDVYRGDIPAEKSLLHFALFLGFFPAVASGPISRAGGLLPQLKDNNRRFSPQNCADALRLMAVGFFKKLAIADMLAIVVKQIYGNLYAYSGLALWLAAALFVLQLYFDFSGYSDIALGTAQLLGIKLPQNFNNPYFATNFSGFWARWHMSLSTWLQDYIFTPLVWSRWTEKLPLIGKKLTKPPVLSSLAIVFLVSGAWHGDTLNFIVWGALMAAYRIGEELFHRWLGKPKKKPPLHLRIGKTAGVLLLWCFSLIFFKIGMEGGSLADAWYAVTHLFTGFSPAAAGSAVYTAIAGKFFDVPAIVLLVLLFMGFCTALGLWADWYQCFKLKGKSLVVGMQRLRPAARWVLYYVLVLCCFAAFLVQSGESFLYGGF